MGSFRFKRKVLYDASYENQYLSLNVTFKAVKDFRASLYPHFSTPQFPLWYLQIGLVPLCHVPEHRDRCQATLPLGLQVSVWQLCFLFAPWHELVMVSVILTGVTFTPQDHIPRLPHSLLKAGSSGLLSDIAE